jgi:hypothetical protein
MKEELHWSEILGKGLLCFSGQGRGNGKKLHQASRRRGQANKINSIYFKAPPPLGGT